MADKINDNAAPKAPESGLHEDNHEAGESEKNDSIPDKPELDDKSKSTDSSQTGKFYSEISSQEWQNLGKNQLRASGKEANDLLKWNPLGEQKDISEKLAAAEKSVLSTIAAPFNFDLAGTIGDFANFASKEASYLFRGLSASFNNPFDSGRQVNDLQRDMGLSVAGLASSAADIGLGVYTPEQTRDLGFNFNFDSGSFSFDGIQSTVSQMWNGVKSWGWDKFKNSLFDDGLSALNGISFGSDSILNNLDFDKNGKVDLWSSLSSSFNDDIISDAKDSSDSGSWWASMKDIGSKALNKITTLGNAVVDFDFGHCKRESHESAGGRLEVFKGKDATVFSSDKTLVQKNKDGSSLIASKDGRDRLEHSADGTDTISSKDKDLVFTRKNGKIEALDKSGQKIASFDDLGDVKRYLDTSVLNTVPPGTDLNKAYEDYKADIEKQIQADPSLAYLRDKAALFLDGKGESLTVQADGTRLYTHKSGDAEMHIPHVGPDKRLHPIEVRIIHDPAGGEDKITIGEKGGPQVELSSKAAALIMAGSRLQLGKEGQLQINDDSSGDPQKQHWADVRRGRRFHLFKDADIDLKTGTVTAKDKDTQIVVAPDLQTGAVKMTDYAVRPGGKPDTNPLRVIQTDGHGKTTIQGFDSQTGKPKADDIVTINAKGPGDITLDAWQKFYLDNKHAQYKDENKNVFDINSQTGDIKATDEDGNPLFLTHGDEVSYDNGRTYKQWLDEYEYERAEDAISQASGIASSIEGKIAALMSSLNIDGAQIDALEQMLSQAIGSLPNGMPLPPQIQSARAAISAAKARDNLDNSIDSFTSAKAGVENDTLLSFARESGTSDPGKAADYALKRAGFKPDEEENK